MGQLLDKGDNSLSDREGGEPISNDQELSPRRQKLIERYLDDECGAWLSYWAKRVIKKDPAARDFVRKRTELTALVRDFHSVSLQEIPSGAESSCWERVAQRIVQEEHAEVFLGTRRKESLRFGLSWGLGSEDRWSQVRLVQIRWGLGGAALASIFIGLVVLRSPDSPFVASGSDVGIIEVRGESDTAASPVLASGEAHTAASSSAGRRRSRRSDYLMQASLAERGRQLREAEKFEESILFEGDRLASVDSASVDRMPGNAAVPVSGRAGARTASSALSQRRGFIGFDQEPAALEVEYVRSSGMVNVIPSSEDRSPIIWVRRSNVFGNNLPSRRIGAMRSAGGDTEQESEIFSSLSVPTVFVSAAPR